MVDLRTRIAAAVFDTRVNQGDPIVTMVDCDGIADAVIRELGLMQQWKALTENGEEMTVDSGENLVTRYISEWRSIHA